MPPKQANAGNSLLEEEEEVVQAVILADSFNSRFKPLTSNRPRCLLPICNATLLDWTFESLALAGVQEIFVICRSHAEQVKTAIKESAWSKENSGIKIVPVVTAKESFTPGDAMRDIYTHGIIKSDFVLVHGDLVSNVRIDEIVRMHKERRRTDKDAIMTIVVKKAGAEHRTKSRGDSSLFVLDSETSECLHYEGIVGFPPKHYAHIPREVIAAHSELEVRYDLIDCNIDICSLEVPSLFQDNFDYGDIRRDFVHGILTSDLLEKKIHCHVIQEGYAARVKDTRLYDSISKDILARWTFPLVPGDHQLGGDAYEYRRGNKYIAKESVTLARTCKVGNNCLIGSGTQVHDNASISTSVIGKNCTIGPGAVVRGCYLWDGAVIGANCTVEESIFGFGVEVRENSRVERGCLLADTVVVGPEAYVEPYTRVGVRRSQEEKENAEDEDEDEIEEVIKDQDPVALGLGASSNGFVWPKSCNEDIDEDDIENTQNQRLMQIGDDGLELNLWDAGSLTSSEDEDSDDEDGDDFLASPTSSVTSLPSTAASGIQAISDEAAALEFQSEVRASLERAFAEDHSVDNAAVELKTLRMASNVPLRNVREAVVGAIVNRIEIVEGAAAQRAAIAKVIGRWGELITKIGGVDPVETVEVLQIHCATSERLGLFGQVLAAFYQDDIVEEDDIRKWHGTPESNGTNSGALEENMKKCWMVGSRMIEQFDAQEGDSDEESDESGDKDAFTQKQPVSQQAFADDLAQETSEDSDSDEDDMQPTQPSSAAKPASEEESSGEEAEDSDAEVVPIGAAPPLKAPNDVQAKPIAPVNEDALHESSEEDEEEDAGIGKTSSTGATSQPVVATQSIEQKKIEESSSEEEESEEDTEEESSEDEPPATSKAPGAIFAGPSATGGLPAKTGPVRGGKIETVTAPPPVVTASTPSGSSAPPPGPPAATTSQQSESSSEEGEDEDEDESGEEDESDDSEPSGK